MKAEELRLSDYQHEIRHINTKLFSVGEKVFLKSNPECQMTVYSINKNNATVRWHNKKNEIEMCSFPPECILQYKYAGLLIYRKKFYVSLN